MLKNKVVVPLFVYIITFSPFVSFLIKSGIYISNCWKTNSGPPICIIIFDSNFEYAYKIDGSRRLNSKYQFGTQTEANFTCPLDY